MVCCSRAPQRDDAPAAAAQATVKRGELRPRTPAPDNRPAIVAFGDSLTAGFGADPDQSYPDDLQRRLDKLGYSFRVINQGVSGETTSDAMSRIDGVIAAKPRIVILEFGGNDGLRGLPIASARSNLEQMIQKLQAAHIRVLLAGLTLPPNYGSEYIEPFERMYHDLAAKYHLRLIPFLLEGVFERGLFQQDGIHPNAQGYEMVAGTVFRYLKPMLGATSPARAHG